MAYRSTGYEFLSIATRAVWSHMPYYMLIVTFTDDNVMLITLVQCHHYQQCRCAR